MKNATDLKFGTHTPIDLSKEWLFIFSKKMTLRVAILEKLPCHVDYPHISSIAMLNFVMVALLLKFPCSLSNK